MNNGDLVKVVISNNVKVGYGIVVNKEPTVNLLPQTWGGTKPGPIGNGPFISVWMYNFFDLPDLAPRFCIYDHAWIVPIKSFEDF